MLEKFKHDQPARELFFKGDWKLLSVKNGHDLFLQGFLNIDNSLHARVRIDVDFRVTNFNQELARAGITNTHKISHAACKRLVLHPDILHKLTQAIWNVKTILIALLFDAQDLARRTFGFERLVTRL